MVLVVLVLVLLLLLPLLTLLLITPTAPLSHLAIPARAHNSHVGDVRATEHHGPQGARSTASDLQAAAIRGAAQVGPKWSLGHLMRETFGASSVYSIGFSTFGGSVTAAPKWGEAAHCFALNSAISGSVGETMHVAMPVVRELHDAKAAHGFALVFSDRGLQQAQQPRAQPQQPQRRQQQGQQPGQQAQTPEQRRMEKHQESVWSRGDPASAAAEAAAEAAKAEGLLETLGSTHLRSTRVQTLKQALYPMRPFRAVGVAYKKDDELRCACTRPQPSVLA